MSSQSNISHIIFNQMSDTKYSTVTKTDGEFYITPDYLDLPILLHQYTDHKLNDISWLRSDTFSWQSGSVYTTVYNKLVSEYNNVNSVTKYAHTGIYSTNQIMTSNNTNGWISQGSNESSGAWYAFNGDWTTSEQCWWTGESVGLPQWIQLKRPDKKFIKSIIVKNEVASPVSPYWGQVYGSNDGTNWTYIKDLQRESRNDTGLQTYELLDSTEPFMYCRIQITSSSSGNSVSIQEIQIEYEDYIEYKETPDGLRIADASQESVINNSYNLTKDTWFYVLDTTNTRFKLPRHQDRILIDSYQSGMNWYRIYSDGWCEQGGQLYYAQGTGFVRVYYPKPFIYEPDIVITQKGSYYSSAYAGQHTDNAQTSTTTYFSTYVDSNIPYRNWRACGYIDVSSYTNLKKSYLYFYVGNYTKTAIEQTAGINSEVLNGKMDNDLGNLPSNIKYIVQSYHNGTQWYRIYNDNYVEQGGYFGATGSDVDTTVSLLIPMSDNKYNVQVNMQWNGSGTASWQYLNARNMTSTSFQTVCQASTYHNWMVTGYKL